MTGEVATLRAVVGSAPAAEPPEPSLRGTVLAGLVIVALFVGAFSGWSLFANLDSGVVASGSVVVDSHRKAVQHLEGGILRKLYVKEGDRVRAGQVLAELDGTQAQAALGQVESQYWAVTARIARLRAEQDGKREIVFPAEIKSRMNEPAIADAVQGQSRLFGARWRAHDSAIEILKGRIAKLDGEIASDTAQLDAVKAQRALVEQELANVERLYAKGYERLPRVLQLKRTASELAGRQSAIRGQIAREREDMASARVEIDGKRDERLAEVGKSLQDALELQAGLQDRMRAARDVARRSAILAPQDGVVVGLKVFTQGGVVAPGQTIMEIVPSRDSLIVEARLRPQDIDAVHVGLDAQVWLSAYKRTDVPPIAATVEYVSADQLADARTGQPYFLTRVKVDAAALAALPEVTLQPGMPAEVMITTGARRAVEYFVSPLVDRMRRAFRER